MSKLLIDEQPLQLLPGLACEIGVNGAIALQQLHWLEGNQALGTICSNRKWIRMTCDEWRVGHFPFWSNATIQRTFEELENKKVVNSRDDLNKLGFDRTKWYSINRQAMEELEEKANENERAVEHSNMLNSHSAKRRNAIPQSGRTIPDTSSEDSSEKGASKSDALKTEQVLSPEGEIEFKTPEPREILSKKERLARVASALAASDPSNAGIADPHISRNQYIEMILPGIMAVLKHVEPSPFDRKVAGECKDMNYPAVKFIEYCRYLESNPFKANGKEPNVKWIFNGFGEWKAKEYPSLRNVEEPPKVRFDPERAILRDAAHGGKNVNS